MDQTTVELNGVRIYTRRVGDGPPVVVLHGGPGAHHDYLLPQYDRLALGRTLLYYDQRGGGRAPVPRDTPVGWREHVADLEALRDHWGLEQVTLLGYSWGGLLAVLYALEHPARIDRLVLVSSPPPPAARPPQVDPRPPPGSPASPSSRPRPSRRPGVTSSTPASPPARPSRGSREPGPSSPPPACRAPIPKSTAAWRSRYRSRGTFTIPATLAR